MQINPLLQQIWVAGDFVGANRAVTRISVQQGKMSLHHHSLLATFSQPPPNLSGTGVTLNIPPINPNKKRRVAETYANYFYNNPNRPLELPNVKSFSWQRGVDTDVASATLELWNVSPLPLGEAPNPKQDKGLDRRGWYTPWRGSWRGNPWGQKPNAWSKLLVPDNIIRSYQGYGSEWLGQPVDPGTPGYVGPEADGNLLPTGVWIIDRVTVSEGGGTVTVVMRDAARLLLDHQVFAPVVPKDFYPLTFRGWDETVQIGFTNPEVKKVKITPVHHSNTYWYNGLQNPIYGHRFKDAFDGENASYWLSVGNVEASKRYAYEYIEVDTHKAEVTEVRFRAKKTGYTAYVSVKTGGVWQGKGKMNYHEDGIGRNDADIHYVKSVHVGTEGEIRVKLPKVYKDATRVRLTFSNLQNFGVGTYHYRAGIREMSVYGQTGKRKAKTQKLTPGPEGANPGRYRDGSNIVELMAAWAGFYRPKKAWQKWCDGTTHYYTFPQRNKVLGDGLGSSTSGFYEPSGWVGPAELGSDLFDQRSLMDVIRYVRDILGFVMFVDGAGNVQWRLPNYYRFGSWLMTGGGRPDGKLAYAPNRVVTLYDDRAILDMSVNFDSTSLRESVYVADVVGKFASLVGGYNPNYTGLRRVGGWTDTHFKSVAETRLMAEMIAVRQMYTYRTNTLSIAGNPCLEIDDQIRILARVSGEGYLHYVRSISSEYDADSGKWTYNLDTFWLGDRSGGDRTPLFHYTPEFVQRFVNGVIGGGA